MKKFKRKVVALYIRVSTLDQAREGYSLEAQENALRKWCADRNYEIYDLYADRGISGKDMTHRPDMGRLMQDAREQKFDVVLFWALSRFTRSVQDLYHTMGVFQEYNIDMVSYTESFDTDSPMGRAMIGIVGVFAQLERELTGERISVALAIRASKGKPTCNAVLGYDKNGDYFLVNEAESEYVKFCFETYLIRKNLTEVAALAKECGFVGKRGRKPSTYSIESILTNPFYCGWNRFNGQIFKGSHDPIISNEMYNKVQRLLMRQGNANGRRRNRPVTYIK